jgi:hypothetical protein
MLELVVPTAGWRKLWLFAAACVRPHWSLLIDPRSRGAVEVSEEVAEGTAAPEALVEAFREAWAVLAGLPDRDAYVTAARAAGRTVQLQAAQAASSARVEVVELEAELWEEKGSSEPEKDQLYRAGQAEGKRRVACLLRDIFNPFGPVSALESDVLTWNDGLVGNLARAAYEERKMPEGTLSGARLAVLADALEEAGCCDGDLLGHLRGSGPHVRGCWAVDRLMGI